MSYHLAFPLSTGHQREPLNFGTTLIIPLPATYILYVCVSVCERACVCEPLQESVKEFSFSNY